MGEKESKTASHFRDVRMTHGRPAGKPSEKKREVEGGPKKKTPSALGARRRAEEATELCLALCGCLAR